MNNTIREIYDDYQYQLVKVALAMQDLSRDHVRDADAFEPLFARSERLEALIDLYAYLLACQGRRAA